MKNMLNKVPQITFIFWVIKIMATTVGETAADYLSETLKLGLNGTSVVMGILLIIVLVFQLKSLKYNPTLYWLVVVLLSIVGTLISDNLVDNLGVSLISSSVIFSSGLAIVLALWYKSENTLSVHTIVTSKRELFYWLTILFTFSLGTAAGDLVAESFGIGYAISASLFISVIGCVFIAYRYFKMNSILAFWTAYILTRPLGASIGDLLSQDHDAGGFGFGTTFTSLIFLLVILGLVVYLVKRERKNPGQIS